MRHHFIKPTLDAARQANKRKEKAPPEPFRGLSYREEERDYDRQVSKIQHDELSTPTSDRRGSLKETFQSLKIGLGLDSRNR